MLETFLGLNKCEWLMILAVFNIGYFGFKAFKYPLSFLIKNGKLKIAAYSPVVMLAIMYFNYKIYSFGLLNFCLIYLMVIVALTSAIIIVNHNRDFNFELLLLTILHTIYTVLYGIIFIYGFDGLLKLDILLAIILAIFTIAMIVFIRKVMKEEYNDNNSSSSHHPINKTTNTKSTSNKIRKKTSSSRDLTIK